MRAPQATSPGAAVAPAKILHLEDCRTDAQLVHRIIAEEWPDCEMRLVANQSAFVDELQRGQCDLILSDFTMAAFSGLEALKLAHERTPDTPFIFVSGTIGEDRAIEALRAGAQDYVLKDRLKRLVATIQRVLREGEEHRKRLRAERLLREQAELLNQAREAIIITDLANRVLYWNAGAERLYGWAPAEAVGHPIARLFTHPDEVARLQLAFDAADQRGEWQGELTLHNQRGDSLIIDLRQTLISDEAGRPKARLSISSDITERKRLEEQFLRAQRLENIGLLAAGIAHDLNNLLAPIVLAGPLLREWVADPNGQRLLDILEASAERGTGLVRQILAFSQGVNGERQLVQTKHLLRDLALFISATFPKQIRLEDRIDADLWTTQANPTQVHQVLLNLCVNARDAMPSGGTLRLRGENCVLDGPAAQAIDGARPGAFLVFHVEDTGTGIAPEVIARMWEPFVTTKAPGKGTGLGLSTVFAIIKDHSGFVQVQTQLGRGTTFRIYLPAADANLGAPVTTVAPPRAVLAARGHGELILVVDDEPSIRDIIATLLTRNGYRALKACDGIEGVLLFAQRTSEIRLVISDIQMPNLDGPTMVRRLRHTYPALKFLLVSGADSLGALAGAREMIGPDAPLLRKPFVAESLLAKVHELLHPPAGCDA